MREAKHTQAIAQDFIQLNSLSSSAQTWEASMAMERPWVSASTPASRPRSLAGRFCLWENARYPFPPTLMALLGPSAASSREAEHLESFLQLGEALTLRSYLCCLKYGYSLVLSSSHPWEHDLMEKRVWAQCHHLSMSEIVVFHPALHSCYRRGTLSS